MILVRLRHERSLQMIWTLGEELRGSKEPACNMEDLSSISG